MTIPLFRPNVDRHGLARDYATYVWLLYGRVVADESPARKAFLYVERGGFNIPYFGQQTCYR